MKLDVILAHREQIFSQIQDGLVPRESICDLFDALFASLKAQNVEFIDFRGPEFEAKVDKTSRRPAKIVDLGQYREKKKRAEFSPEPEGDGA